MSRGLRRWIVALACTANGVAATAGGATPVFEQPLQSVRIGSQPQGISIFDMDGDGSLDLVVIDRLDTLYVLHNNGAGSFSLSISVPTFGTPRALLAMDIDSARAPPVVGAAAPRGTGDADVGVGSARSRWRARAARRLSAHARGGAGALEPQAATPPTMMRTP